MVGTVDQQYAVVDPDPAAVIGRPGQAIGPVIIHHIAHEIARQIIAFMPTVPPILSRHTVIAEAGCEKEIQAHARVIPESVIVVPPVAVALPHRAAVPVLIVRLPLVCLLDMAGRDDLIAARCLDLWSSLGLRLDLSPERPLRVVSPLHSVGRLLSLGSGLRLDWRLHLDRSLRFRPLPPLLSLGSGLRLDRRLHLDRCLRFRPLLPLLSLRSGLCHGRSLGLNLSGSRGWRRLNLCWGFAPASALAMSPAGLFPAGLGLLLPRIGRPVLMLAAVPIVGLRQCRRSARNQNGNSGRSKKRFHKMIQSFNERRVSFWSCKRRAWNAYRLLWRQPSPPSRS